MEPKIKDETKRNADNRHRDNLRTYQRSMRQISTMQRGIMKIMGLNTFPSTDLSTSNVLVEDLPAGFCYKHNGEPKSPLQFFYSASKKVVYNIEGKEGLLPTPAQNVVGDSPMMNEILSKPKLLNLLCELRNTSTLMNNVENLKKFAAVLKSHPHSELPYRDNPKEYILAYRISLIKQFLLALKSEVDLVLKDESKTAIALKEETKLLVPHQKMTISQWNETQEEKRAGIQRREEQRAKLEAERKARERAKALAIELEIEAAAKVEPTEEEIWHRQLKAYSVIPTLYKNREIGFDKYRHPPDNEIPQIPVVPTVGASSEEQNSRPIQRNQSKGTNASRRQKSKDDFETYIRGLIDNIKEVCEMGKTVKGLQRKKPQINERVAESLMRLLGRDGLFKSLNADDFAFMDYEGGKQSLVKRMAKKLNQIKPGGFTFIVPSLTELHQETDFELDRKMNETWDKVMGLPSNSMASKDGRPDSTDTETSHRSSKTPTVQNGCRGGICYKKSMNRVCCPACKTKIKQAYEGVQSRNIASLKAVPTWKNSTKNVPAANRQSVSINPHKTHHFLNLVPPTTHKNYSHKFTKIENLPKKTLAKITSLNPKKSEGKIEVKSILSKKGQPKSAARKVDFTSNTKFNESQLAEEQVNKPRSKLLFSTKPNAKTAEIPSLIKYSEVPANSSLKSWALLVSKMDILKLMHELDTHIVGRKKSSFEDQFISF